MPMITFVRESLNPLGGPKLRLVLLPAALGVALVAACSPPSDPAPSSTELSEPKSIETGRADPLRLDVRAGDVFTYVFEQDEEIAEYRKPGSDEVPGTINNTIRATLVRKCVSAADGVFEFEDRFQDVRVETKCGGRLAGTEDVVAAERRKEFSKPGVSRFDNRFRPVGPDGVPVVTAAATAYFPEGALVAGETWGGEVPDVTNPRDPGSNLQGMMPKITFRYGGTDQIGEWTAVKIDAESSGSEAMTLDGPASSWFDSKSGALVRFTATIRASAPRMMTIKMVMDLKSVEPAQGVR